MNRFYDFLVAWGAVAYRIGFLVCLFGSWYWAGDFDIAYLVIDVCWPAMLLVLLGALASRFDW